MKVSDFQKHLRALAEIIATKTPSKELSDAADALNAFAHYKMTDFAKFLQLAEAKYASTGELPDAKGAKPAKESSTKKEAAQGSCAHGRRTDSHRRGTESSHPHRSITQS